MAYGSQMREPVEQNPWRNAVMVLITPFENDELWKHKPAQMRKLRPQWLYSLGFFFSDSAAREAAVLFMTAAKPAEPIKYS